MTREEKQVWDEVRQDKRDCDERIAKLEKRVAKDPNNREIQRQLELERRLRAKIVQFVPD